MVTVSMGDISEQQTSTIVNWTDGDLANNITGCSQSIATRSGTLMRTACLDYIKAKGKL